MNLLIRKIKQSTICRLNKLSKEKGISREEFLREELEKIAFKNELNHKENEYKVLMENLTNAIILNTQISKLFIEEYLLDVEESYNTFSKYESTIDELKTKNFSLNKYYESDIKFKDLKINDIPVDLISVIDEIAESKNLSRNRFLFLYLSQLKYPGCITNIDEKYNMSKDKALDVLTLNYLIFKQFYDENII